MRIDRKDQVGAFSEGEIWLDISRLLYRVIIGNITGIDRVEIAYADGLLNAAESRVRFVAYDYVTCRFRRLDDQRTRKFIGGISASWSSGDMASLRRAAWRGMFDSIVAAPAVPRYKGGPRPIYVNVSMHPLHLVNHVGKMLHGSGALFTPMIHDTIPLDYPEYVPPSWTQWHEHRMEAVRQFADGLIANSAFTTAMLKRHAVDLPILTAPLGVHTLTPSSDAAPRQPYFLCVGTIEPRKNHLLLLNAWRQMVHKQGGKVPLLVIVGRRGWENEQVVDMLERCHTLRAHVREVGMVSDGMLARLMQDARALLMPSFTEGYGLPVAEALSLGTPVICSDIPAHRQIGDDVPEYIDPLNGPAWVEAIAEYGSPNSSRRQAQMQRLCSFSQPSWSDHIDKVLSFHEDLRPRRPLPGAEVPRRQLVRQTPDWGGPEPVTAAARIPRSVPQQLGAD